MTKWFGAAAWNAKEARAGDRLPYARLADENTLLLRDGSLMMALQVPGLLFETEDTDALNAHAATREVMLRSTLDARFVLYHHVIRRKVEVELDAEFDRLLQPVLRLGAAESQKARTGFSEALTAETGDAEVVVRRLEQEQRQTMRRHAKSVADVLDRREDVKAAARY